MQINDLVDQAMDRLVVPSFTALGPAVRRRLFSWDPIRLDGRRIAVTGPTSGLGLATVTLAARLGAEVVLLARDRDRAEALGAELRRAGGTDVTVIELDLADLSSAERAAAELASLDRLDALVHNGGGLYRQRRLSVDGIELTLAVHVVAPFLLTAGAVPALARSTDARVVTVASGGLYGRALDIDDIQSADSYRGPVAYARAKRAQVVLTRRWADELAPLGVTAHAMHPGWVDTPGLAEALPRFHRLLRPALRSADDGADTVVWLCGAPQGELGSGRFWLDRRPRPTEYLPGTATSPDDADTLWDLVASLAGVDPTAAAAGPVGAGSAQIDDLPAPDRSALELGEATAVDGVGDDRRTGGTPLS